jgi:hypothetical protein
MSASIDTSVIEHRRAPKLTRAQKERAVTELASRLAMRAGVTMNASRDGTVSHQDLARCYRRERWLIAAVARVAMARTSD